MCVVVWYKGLWCHIAIPVSLWKHTLCYLFNFSLSVDVIFFILPRDLVFCIHLLAVVLAVPYQNECQI